MIKQGIRTLCAIVAAAVIATSCTSPYIESLSADFDKDGKADTAVIGEEGRNTTITVNYGSGYVQQIATIGYEKSVTGIEIKDYNKDGNQDVGVIWCSRGYETKAVFMNILVLYNHNSDGNTPTFAEEKPKKQ